MLEKTLESPLDCKETQPVHPKGDQSWVFIGRADTKAKTPILWPSHAKSRLWKRPWCWEGLGAGGEGDDRGSDGLNASTTWWTWVWVNSRSWWWTGRPGMLQSMRSQRVGHSWVTELYWIQYKNHLAICPNSKFQVLKWNSLSHVWLFATPGTIKSMEFSRLEYWSGWPFPSPGYLPNPGIEPRSPALQADSLPANFSKY